MGKICSKCGIEKDTSEFVKSSRKKDGLCPSCRECKKAYNIQHKKEISEYNANYKIEHKEEVAKRDKEYQKNTKSARNAYKQSWTKNKIKTNIEYQKKHLTARNVSYALKPEILRRDNFKCALCESTNNLAMHHIIPVAVNITLIATFSNLITLCKTCHLQKAHKGNTATYDEALAQTLLEIVKSRN